MYVDIPANLLGPVRYEITFPGVGQFSLADLNTKINPHPQFVNTRKDHRHVWMGPQRTQASKSTAETLKSSTWPGMESSVEVWVN